MSKINSRQLFGKPFVFSHPEIFPEEVGNLSSPLYPWLTAFRMNQEHTPLPQPRDPSAITFEVKVTIRRVQQ